MSRDDLIQAVTSRKNRGLANLCLLVHLKNTEDTPVVLEHITIFFFFVSTEEEDTFERKDQDGAKRSLKVKS